MPLASAPAIALIALVAILAAIASWFLRGLRCRQEKRAVNAVWQDQLEAKQTEHDRLESQNTSLTQQVSQYQASIRDARNRSQELAELLREATDHRDELQREQKSLRDRMDKAARAMDDLRTEAAGHNARQKAAATALKEGNDTIAHLKGEISNWHSRVLPLVERYRTRNAEAEALAVALDQARARIAEFERPRNVDETRIEPMDSTSGIFDASNDQFEETAHNDMAAFDDQPMTPDGYEPGSDRYSHYSRENLGPRDDLKRIRGVGPAIEKTLNDLGFFRFEQIAGLSDHDISRIADRLRGFSSRIHRDDWIGQARMLHYEKSDYAE